MGIVLEYELMEVDEYNYILILFITCEQPNLNYKPTTFYLSIVLLMDNKFVGVFFILYTKRNSYISIFSSTIFSIKNFYLVKIIFKKYSCEI